MPGLFQQRVILQPNVFSRFHNSRTFFVSFASLNKSLIFVTSPARQGASMNKDSVWKETPFHNFLGFRGRLHTIVSKCSKHAFLGLLLLGTAAKYLFNCCSSVVFGAIEKDEATEVGDRLSVHCSIPETRRDLPIEVDVIDEGDDSDNIYSELHEVDCQDQHKLFPLSSIFLLA